MGNDRRPFSAAGCGPGCADDGTSVRKLDSPKNKLLPSDAAATVIVPEASACIIAGDGPVVADLESCELSCLLADAALGEIDCDWKTATLSSGPAPSVDSSFVLERRGFRGYLPLFDGTMTHSAWFISQLVQGALTITSHLTLRRLHSLQACLARERFLPSILSRLAWS